MLECVVNVSEGRDAALLDDLSARCGAPLLDRHADERHNRAVFTLGGPGDAVEHAVRALAEAVVLRLDLSQHAGVHPRFGALDVVPFVDLGQPTSAGAAAMRARDHFAAWAGEALSLPCFLYGPMPDGTIVSLPDVRRTAFTGRSPDTGPMLPHPTAGATAVGARGVMLAYNVWVSGLDLAGGRRIAASLRRREVRALAFDLGTSIQISCNLIEPLRVGPAALYDEVAASLEGSGARVTEAEVVGLAPHAVVGAVPKNRWAQLGLSAEATIEARLESGSLRRP